MYKIYMIEDDEGIFEASKKHGEKYDLKFVGVNNFRKIIEEFKQIQPHLVIMDIGLPSFDGYYWCTKIREISTVPIIFLSSAALNMNMVMAMNMGGDDFVAKPFDYEVLLAKIQALLRRTYSFGTAEQNTNGELYLNKANCTLVYHNESLDLTKNEYRILSVLMDSQNEIVSREKLMDTLWESDCYIDDNTLTVNINRLRKKLSNIGLNDLIVTKKGLGYLLNGIQAANSKKTEV
ncbi:MAG: response regulator transcription factor [Acutalibacteraceae bacterium]|nr:response regulator transcription factor [Acutalibacteraceae bacterium]